MIQACHRIPMSANITYISTNIFEPFNIHYKYFRPITFCWCNIFTKQKIYYNKYERNSESDQQRALSQPGI